MAKVTYIEWNGRGHTVEIKNGMTVMAGAIRNGIPGILAECGGACACATCHVYVEENWIAQTGERSEMEASLLEYASEVRENSRLCCQIKVSDTLDGLVVHLPQMQG